MHAFVYIAILCLVATAHAQNNGGYGHEGGYRQQGGYGHVAGFRRTGYGITAIYRNDARQIGVNRVAEHVGSGTGTARWYGVPGTGHYFPRRQGYGGGHGSGYGGHRHAGGYYGQYGQGGYHGGSDNH